MLNAPKTFRIPPLYRENPAQIIWEQTDDASGYELDMSIEYDDSEPMSFGRTWGQIAEAGLTRGQIDALGLTWGEFQNLPFNPNDFTPVYKGAGEAVAPEQGFSWQEMCDSDLTWERLRQLSKNWGELKALGPVTNFAGGTIDIPDASKRATFRIRAYSDSGEDSGYLTAGIIPITQFFHDDDNIRFDVKEKSNYRVQIYADRIHDFGEKVFLLKYEPMRLRLEGFEPEGPERNKKFDIAAEGFADDFEIISHNQALGELRFRCAKEMPAGKEWSGLVLSVKFKALRTIPVQITMKGKTE